MRSAASLENTRRFFARRAVATATDDYASRESRYRVERAQWERAHPDADCFERDAAIRAIAKKNRI